MDRSVPEKKVSDNRLAMSKASQINNWLITEGRLLKDDKAIIAAFAQKMIDAGVPITRFSVAERFANPLLVAMLVSWTEKGIQSLPIPRSMLSSNAYWGSPFEFVQNHRKMLRKRLDNLNLDTEHSIYVEQATVGATEYIAQALCLAPNVSATF